MIDKKKTQEFLTWIDVQEVKRRLTAKKHSLVWYWDDVDDEEFNARTIRLFKALEKEGIKLPDGFEIKTKPITF